MTRLSGNATIKYERILNIARGERLHMQRGLAAGELTVEVLLQIIEAYRVGELSEAYDDELTELEDSLQQ